MINYLLLPNYCDYPVISRKCASVPTHKLRNDNISESPKILFIPQIKSFSHNLQLLPLLLKGEAQQ